jgi:hypothetical protein
VTYAQAQRVAGRGIAALLAFGLITYPYLLGTVSLPVPALLTESYAQLLRWGGVAWLSLAFAPWSRLAPAVAFWPGADPHNFYGLVGIILAVLAAMGLISSIILPLILIIALSGGGVHWGFLFGGIFGGAFGIWALRASIRMQRLAAHRDGAAA